MESSKFFVGCFLIFSLTFMCSLKPMKLHKRQPSSPILNPLSDEKFYLDKTFILGEDSWNNYKEEDAQELNSLKISSVKAVFILQKESEHYYLVSHKKARNNDPRKDNKFEFLGGKLKKKEDIFTALLREIIEEDYSLVLARQITAVKEQAPNSLCYKIIETSKERHAIFVFLMKEDDYKKLLDYYKKNETTSPESYGFTLVHESDLEITKKTKEEKWTPKSVKILAALKQS